MLEGLKEQVYVGLQKMNSLDRCSSEFLQQDNLVANEVYFFILNSPVFKDTFSGSRLFSSFAGDYSFVEIIGKTEALPIKVKIRSAETVDLFSFMYEYSEGDDDFEPWEKGNSGTVEITLDSISKRAFQLIDIIKDNSPLMQKILSPTSKNLKDLDKISYEVIAHDSDVNVLDFCVTESKSCIADIKKVFVHRYFNYRETDNIYIVAKNWLAPVGIICLFDTNLADPLRANSRTLSISYVSVTPEYRNIGISKNLIRQSFVYAKEHNKYLSRTRPSDIGRLYSYDSFTQLAAKEFPAIPFVKREYISFAYQVNKAATESKMSYGSECKALNYILSKIDQSVDTADGRIEHSNISREVDALIRKLFNDNENNQNLGIL